MVEYSEVHLVACYPYQPGGNAPPPPYCGGCANPPPAPGPRGCRRTPGDPALPGVAPGVGAGDRRGGNGWYSGVCPGAGIGAGAGGLLSLLPGPEAGVLPNIRSLANLYSSSFSAYVLGAGDPPPFPFEDDEDEDEGDWFCRRRIFICGGGNGVGASICILDVVGTWMFLHAHAVSSISLLAEKSQNTRGSRTHASSHSCRLV